MILLAKRYPAIFIFIILSCHTGLGNITRGQVYINGNKPDPASVEEIIKITNLLVQGTLHKDISILKNYTHKEKGIYLDLKGLWTYQELLEELQKKNSYFWNYYYDSSNKDRMSVRNILLKAKGLRLDFYFEGSETCEVKIRFIKNTELENNLNNPYFIRQEGKWYIYRMF